MQERFFIFLGLICFGTWFTGYYYHYKWDKEIQESMHKSEEISQKHIIHSMTKSMAIDHWKAMYCDNPDHYTKEELEAIISQTLKEQQ